MVRSSYVHPDIVGILPRRGISLFLYAYQPKPSIDWLSHLQSRPKWNSPTTNLKLNDMVLIRDDRSPPNKWLLGRAVELHPGDDGLVRVVIIKTKNGNYKRSISKICRLPIDNECGEGTQI